MRGKRRFLFLVLPTLHPSYNSAIFLGLHCFPPLFRQLGIGANWHPRVLWILRDTTALVPIPPSQSLTYYNNIQKKKFGKHC
jgi:hypothetical protein